MKIKIHSLFVVLVSLVLSTLDSQFSTALAQGTAFTYQGRLNDGANPANGTYEILFRPFNVSTGGSQLTIPNDRLVVVSNGLFTTTMDFGSAMFGGAPVFLQLEVRTNGTASFIVLAPRQQLTPTPYAIYASGAGASGITGTIPASALANAWLLSGNSNVVSGQFVGTTGNQPFDLYVNNVRAMRYRLNTDAVGNYTNAPNVLGGSSINGTVTTGVVGATIAGGGGNFSDGTSLPNRATADFGTIGGGAENTASDFAATVAGGYGNTASGPTGTVGGGEFNTTGGYNATVPGGFQNAASADYTFAAGYRAKADDRGSFVWADASDFDFHSTTPNQFRVRAIGGTTFVTAIDGSGNVTAGVHVLAGDTAWSSISDRNAKKNFQSVDGEAVLDKLAAIPVEKWNYKWESDTNTPHIGPMAQDFKGAFYPGRDDKSISTLEFDGVELAAIQGLNEKVEVRGQKSEDRIQKLEAENAELKQRLEALEKIILNQKPK
jgi:Chaperone of endosialidase